MAGSESVLEALLEEETLDDLEEDVDMLDAEEGEIPSTVSVPPPRGNEEKSKVETHGNKNRRNGVKRKKNKKQKTATGSVANINRFVIDTCRHLKERKQYLVWNAVGCLGVPALRELIKEVDAIQDCGGQLTADGNRPRTGGGILWNILKTREPDVYKEIMAKGKELEKQLCQGNRRQAPKGRNNEAISSKVSRPSNNTGNRTSDPPLQTLEIQPKCEEKAVEGRISVMNRMRVPVAYDDL